MSCIRHNRITSVCVCVCVCVYINNRIIDITLTVNEVYSGS